MTLGKDSNFCYADAQITTWIIWSICKTSSKTETLMLLDASARGIILQMIEPQVKDIIKKMCMNEYRSKSERSVKLETLGTPKGMLPLYTYTALLVQLNC